MRVDVAVIGSGFSGSILAWVLATKGMRVAIIDCAKHPRFAIGESSTPIADALMRRLGQQHGIEELVQLSSWGSWQATHSQLPCGIKRGFSYLKHGLGEPFVEQELGSRSLLVAASPSDTLADTHWYRPTTDTYLFGKAVDSGVVDLTGHQVVSLFGSELGPQQLICERIGRGSGSDSAAVVPVQIDADWIVDASGQAQVMASFGNVEDWTSQLKTKTKSCFAHFQGVMNWADAALPPMKSHFNWPFSADDAAQHHLLAEGWMWMLRFNHGITSIGYTTASDRPLYSMSELSAAYPTIGKLMSGASQISPVGAEVRTARLQRWVSPVFNPRCLMLPTAALTLDPLHSTGIAHALAGVERLVPIITRATQSTDAIEWYSKVLQDETILLDQLVSLAYRHLHDFERFTVACMLFFAGAIRCEERYQQGVSPTHLWNADDPAFVEFVQWASRALDSTGEVPVAQIRERLQPWNSADLMNPESENRYAYTATKS